MQRRKVAGSTVFETLTNQSLSPLTAVNIQKSASDKEEDDKATHKSLATRSSSLSNIDTS